MKKTIKAINNLIKVCTQDEIQFLNTLLEKLDSFNSVYLLTIRFTNKIDEYSEDILKMDGMDPLIKYHIYLNIGVKFSLVVKDEELEVRHIINTFKTNLESMSSHIDKKMIYDKGIEETLINNSFYMLIFILKIMQINKIEGDKNEE